MPIFRSKVAVEDARAASGIGITAGCALGLRKWPQLEIPRVIPAHARPGAAASGGGYDARACQHEAPLVCRLDDGTRHRRLTGPRSAGGRYQSQARQLAILLALVHSWGTGYDWRKAEAKLNALPQFVEDIE